MAKSHKTCMEQTEIIDTFGTYQVQKPMPFPSKSVKTKEEEHYNKFCEWMKPLFLQIPLTDAIKLLLTLNKLKLLSPIKEKSLMRQYLLCLLTTLSVARFLRS